MKHKIKILDKDIINQIAAGEVVENPASVVKELVENSLDAGAKHITVLIVDGGKSLIQVVDDGEGMSKEDAILALQRHATSKIRTFDDLKRVQTMGFRGEALPSIASVSKFTLTTSTGDDAVQVRYENGQVISELASHPKGTTVEVKELFYNVPARKKFLKSDRTEGNKVHQVMLRYVYARPDVHFVFYKDSRKVFDLSPAESLMARAIQVLGSDMATKIFPVELKGEFLSVYGVIGEPMLARQGSNRMIFFINGRPVIDKTLKKAVISAYGPLIPQGRYPFVVLDIHMAPELVDVNCHPQKTEVRFASPGRVFEGVYKAVNDIVRQTPWIKKGGGYQVKDSQVLYSNIREYDDSIIEPVQNHQIDSVVTIGDQRKNRFSNMGIYTHTHHEQNNANLSLFEEEQTGKKESLNFAYQSFDSFSSLKYLGQIHRTILVLEGPDVMVLIDQHAAHERINYERFKKAFQGAKKASQPLLFPAEIRLDVTEMEIFEGIKEALIHIGYEFRELEHGIEVTAVPTFIRSRDPIEVLRTGLGQANGRDLDNLIATMACHASIRAGDELSPEDVAQLLKEMDETAYSTYCPHGRQAVVVLPVQKVLRWFGR